MFNPSTIGTAFVDATIIVINARKEPPPLRPGTPIRHKRHGTVLTRPVVVRYHTTEVDFIALHEHGRELGGTIPRAEMIMASTLALTHLNTDGMAVTGIGTGMPPGFGERQILHNHKLVNGKVPATVREGTPTKSTGVLHSR